MKKSVIFLVFFSLFFTLFCLNAHADENNIENTVEECVEDVAEPDAQNTVDIGLFYGSSAKSSVTITSYGNSVTVNAADIDDTAEYTSDGIIAADGTKYRGSIILKKDGNGLITVINRVNMEDYIASVIAIEMSPSFNIEALKAQAVCARTYAEKNRGKHKSYGFDLCASTDCQAYKGVSAESDTTNLAASATSGQVMTYDGCIIDAVYSATSGGWTEDVENVWGSDIPYLAGVEDSYESKDVYGSSWTKEITVEKATEIMNNKGYDIGTVTDISVVSSTEHGVVTKLKVTGTNGEKTFTKEGCRLAFGTVTLSQAFSVTPLSDADQKSETLYIYGGNTVSGKVSVISGDGISKTLLDNVCLQGSTKKDYSVQTNAPATSFVFDGRGYGHLVGMSQNGANGMAKAGFTYDEILKHYYKGIELT